MEADWHLLHGVQVAGYDVDGYGPSANVGTIAFDPNLEILWVGDCHGWVTSYASASLERYTSYRAHAAEEGAVLQFLFNDRSVISLASQSVHATIRRGLVQWHTSNDSMTRMNCFTFIHKGASILAAGDQPLLLKLDAEKGTVTEEIPTNSRYTLFRSGRYICAATNTGSVDFLDPSSLQIIKTWQAHTASISDMDLSRDSLVTCGRAIRPHGPAMLESLAKVYNLRTMEQMGPIPFQSGAAYVQIHPKLTTTCVLGAPSSGQFQVVDLINHNTSNLVSLASQLGGPVTHFQMSGSGNVWATADNSNIISIWGSSSKIPSFNENMQSVEWPDEPEQVPFLSIDRDVPFATIGMPYYRDRLLSAWGSEPWEVGYMPDEIDPEIERNLRPATFGQIAPKPPRINRNIAHRKRTSDTSAFSPPKLLSEQAKAIESGEGNGRRMSEAAEALADLSFSGATRNEVQWYYMNVKIKYGKYGVADFDFRAYNNTRYSGLETDISNHYLNPILQLGRYTPMIRNHALYHVAGPCLDEKCLFCEFGFLFDMLEKANGEVCQATNLLKTFSNLNEASRKGILEEEGPATSLTKRLSDANNFLLSKIIADSRRIDTQDCFIERVFVLTPSLISRCTNCHGETYEPYPVMTLDLRYPDYHQPGRNRASPRFSEILKSSFYAQKSERGYCPHCKRHPMRNSRRTFMELPGVLMIDAALERSAKSNVQYWAHAGWLPEEIGLTINHSGDVLCYEGDRLEHFRNHENVAVYELVGLVADISSTQGQRSHPVAFINVSISEPARPDGVQENEWHLFNDFLVRSVKKEEALRFAPAWKTPIILSYQLKASRHFIDDSWKTNPDISCLYSQGSLNKSTDQSLGFPLQSETETPQPGFHLSIDAEFVSLEPEEIEARVDGTIGVIRPVRQGTGRISALRGSGENEGVPFIDDYIKINEPIVDHLTQYSGLRTGDLDPRRSTHALQSLKVAYKKLWLLLNLGCTFVGHGLASDFRTINIHIPPDQIVDTVTLFRPQNEKRRLSLRFLAWFFLDEEIQTGNHDSIVDARTALRLWRKYQEFVDQGILAEKLVEIYREGPSTAFKPPREFEAQGGKIGHRARKKLGEDSSGYLTGRITPEMGGSGVSSAVGTPAPMTRKREGEGYFGSPLK